MATSKKKSTSKKNTKRVKKVNENEQAIEDIESFNFSLRKIIVILSCMIIIFSAFYFITVYVTSRDSSSDETEEAVDDETSYTDTMAGRSFNMPEEEYYVLFYDRSDEDLLNSLSPSISNYRAIGRTILYTVDMSDAINKNYEKETSNWNPASASELAIKGPTLIHFRDHKVLEYFEGETDIISQLDEG